VIEIPRSRAQHEAARRAARLGEALIAEGGAAAFTAAGGQSSRLGLDTPKGTYPASPVRQKSLFQLHAEKIACMQVRYETRIPWLIMTSETNNEATTRYFEENGYFGLDPHDIRFIVQGMFPALDEHGRLILAEKNRLFMNPTGHGGTFMTLHDSGALEWLKERGVQEIFYFQVDNVLVRILDPRFLGYHVEGNCDMSSKCVTKRDMGEKIGVFVIEDGAPTVVEYSELSSIELEDGSGLHELTAGNVAIHIINVDYALHRIGKSVELPLHVAHKAIPHIDDTGGSVSPSKPSGYKMETFIFDALKYVRNSVIMEVKREEEFSPLKNRTGEDSPETVLRDQLRFFASWFEDAGIQVPRGENGEPRYRLEVSPIYAAWKEMFVQKVDRHMHIDGDTYIGLD
jgi:UDP-N-acetylglucosamine/UDP-N-acetylgalactosamine diphosphorylase